MALPRGGQWDVTYLASKYPWLLVDRQALEDFRSPFNWVADASPVSPVSPACSSDDGHEDKVQVRKRNGKCRVRFKGKELQPGRNGRHKGKKKQAKSSETRRNHEKLFSATEIQTMNNVPPLEELKAPSTRDTTTMMPLLSVPTLAPSTDRLKTSDLMLELLQRDHDTLLHIRHHKKPKKRTKPSNVLALKFPIITTKSLRSVSKLDGFALKRSPTARTSLDNYAKQIQNLTEEEHRLEESVMARIAEEKSRLPLTFLFERNLMCRSDAQVDGLRVVTAIFAKLQHRMLFNSFTRWKEFLDAARHEDRRIAALFQAQRRAVKLLERVSSDAYVGTLAQGFQLWRTVIQQTIEQERNLAASVIQKAVRARRSMLHLDALRQAAQAADYRRNQAIQALLRFERYGTMMKWGTLRIGFDFAKQNRAARNLQLFLRRVAVRRRVGRRVRCKEGAIRIQAQWRAHLARQEVAVRREERVRRLILETKAAIQMERIVRGFLARNQVFRRKQWLIKANLAAFRLQRWLRHRLFLAVLHSKFRERKRLIEYARARASAEELARLRWRSAIAVQCVFRGLLARRIYERKLRAHRKEQAAIYLQRFWRRRQGLYALGLRFAERKERLIQCRLQGAIVIQSAFRCYRARCKRFHLAAKKEERRQASTVIQRHVRGWIARNHYRRFRQAAVTIQSGIRCALARRCRTRRYQAVLKLQQWTRGVYACRAARKVLYRLQVEARRREASVLLIQKLVRQREAEQTARLFREALNIVKTEQRRYFGSESDDARGGMGWSTHQASSELLTYVTQRFLEDDTCFTTKELRWLRAQVQAGRERLAREDKAAVFLQRRYRGYATRMGYWVHRLQMEELRRLKEKKAIVIQSGARRWLAKRYVRHVREQRRLAELKEAYIRERKRKEEERVWKERYDREQMELCVQKAQEAANQLREARREADLARVKAEAAEYRAKELAAEREIESLLKTPVVKKPEEDPAEEKDPWIQLQDDFGNVYYYNEITGNSSWDPPPPKSPKTSPVEEESKEVETELLETSEDAKIDEVDPLEEILREGKCIKCQRLQAMKQCLDCNDTKRAFYCTSCFKHHTVNPNEENLSTVNKTKHDFEVVPEAAAVPARCQSELECAVDNDTNNQETKEKGLAAYYCYGCSTDHTPTTVANDTEPSGCFYCENCFARDHDTVQKLRHVDKALRFRRGALLCCDCCHALAVRQCESCGGDKFCETCFISSHSGSKNRSLQHTWTALDVLRDLLEKETDRYCVECDVRASSRLCNLCGDGFCDGCFDKTHAKGAKRRHTWLPWSVAAQHGDWIEIKDDKATIYFNVETKESTNDKPRVLISGEERHRLELAEREQLQRSRQVELESEVVKLKEQLRELQQQERPGSRDRTPVKKIDNYQNAPPTKPPKRGVVSKLFGRNPPPQAPTLGERQEIAQDLTNRVRAEKQPVSSPIFQQAMVQELTALAMTSSQPK